MKSSRLSLILSIVAALLALATFVYKLVARHQTDWFILFAGVFILAVGLSRLSNKQP